eukprot:SAG22_NODE_58_length_23645_cov_16.637943_18_plen_80_part_00
MDAVAASPESQQVKLEMSAAAANEILSRHFAAAAAAAGSSRAGRSPAPRGPVPEEEGADSSELSIREADALLSQYFSTS